MNIVYKINERVTAQQYIDVLNRSTLGARRPVGDPERIQKMLDHANLLITAWDKDKLVGVSRSVTDFSFCCYLSDLAVDKAYQKKGIGKRLIELTNRESTDQSMLLLLSVPTAMDYYPSVGFEKVENGFIIQRKK